MDYRIYKDFLKYNNCDNNSVKRESFEAICYILSDNGMQNIVDEFYIDKALEDIENGLIVANGEGYYVAYFKKGKKYYSFNSHTNKKEVTTLLNIKRHISSDAYEIQRYFNTYIHKNDIDY